MLITLNGQVAEVPPGRLSALLAEMLPPSESGAAGAGGRGRKGTTLDAAAVMGGLLPGRDAGECGGQGLLWR